MTDDNYEWIKHELGPYRIQKSRWGTFTSIHEDGTSMVTGATEDAVRVCTEDIHLPFYYGSDASDIQTTEYNDISTDELK